MVKNLYSHEFSKLGDAVLVTTEIKYPKDCAETLFHLRKSFFVRSCATDPPQREGTPFWDCSNWHKLASYFDPQEFRTGENYWVDVWVEGWQNGPDTAGFVLCISEVNSARISGSVAYPDDFFDNLAYTLEVRECQVGEAEIKSQGGLENG